MQGKIINNHDCCVLVASCDHYADLWDPFFILFQRYWPDCHYPVFLSSNYLRYIKHGVKSLPIGKDLDWSQSLINTLRLPELNSYSYILLILDDLLLYKKVDSLQVQVCLDTLINVDGNYLRMVPSPPPNKNLAEPNWLGEISPSEPYRASLQASLWRKQMLISLLQPGESPWDFEILASQRSNNKSGFYCTRNRILRYLNSVERGLWQPEAIDFLQRENISITNSERKIKTSGKIPQNMKRSKILSPWRLLPLKLRMALLAWIRNISK